MHARTLRVLALALTALPAAASAQTLFMETFDDLAAAGRWTTLSTSDVHPADFVVDHAFDYSALGVPAAPMGSTTIGVKIDANTTAQGAFEAEGVSIFANGGSFSGNHAMRAWHYARVVGDAGTTEDALFGIHGSGTRANWYTFAGPGTDGNYYSLTGDGGTGSANDYIRYTGNTAGDPTAIALFDNGDPVPQFIFPAADGTPAGSWSLVDVRQAGGFIEWRVNGWLLDRLENASGFNDGRLFVGHQDLFDSVNADTFSIFDDISALRVPVWQSDADGAWSDASFAAESSGAGVPAYFPDVITAPRTVTLTGQRTAGELLFDATSSFTIAGPHQLVLQHLGGNEAAIDVLRGAHAITSTVSIPGGVHVDVLADASLSIPGVVQGGTGRFLKLGRGTLEISRVRANELNVNNGTLRLLPAGGAEGVSIVNQLATGLDLFNEVYIDITSSALAVDYSAGEASPLADLKALILSGYAGGAWNGLGIYSSLANATTFGVGYAEASAAGTAVLPGSSLDDTTVIIRGTFYGDANLDGQVNVTDLGLLASGWQQAGDWVNGDFNYDGTVDVADLGALATNWQAGGAGPTAPGASFEAALAAVGLSSVPEPALLPLAALAGLSLRRRRA